MRVVYLSPSSQLGGAEAVLLDVLASLRAAEPNWSLNVITSSTGPLVARAESLGVQTIVLSFPPSLARLGDHPGAHGSGAEYSRSGRLAQRLAAAWPAAFQYARRLKKVLIALGPDLVHSNGLKMHVLSSWSRPKNVPIVWHMHEYVGSRPLMSRLLRWNSSRCAAAVAISRSVASDIRAVCNEQMPVHLLYNAVDTADFSPHGPDMDLDAAAGLPPPESGTVRIGLPATLATWKGHEVFLRALAMLPASLPIRGYVIGGEIYEPLGSQSSLAELRRLAAHLGLQTRVGFTGFLQQPAPAIRALDVVVHASTRPEPFGRVIVEAMGCGRPVIISNAGGAAEIVEVGYNALAHPPGNAASLAERIQQLATDPALRQRLGNNGRATVERHFDRSRLAAELRPIYRNAVVGAK